MIKVNIKTAIYDFEWVIRITNSSKTKTQIDVAYKCFNLWELKHVTNNVTEKEGVNYLIENSTGFFKIDLSTKKELLDLLNIEHRFLQAFDLIYVPEMVGKIVDTEFVNLVQ